MIGFLRRNLALLAVVLIALVVAACGGEEEKKGGGGASAPPAEDKAIKKIEGAEGKQVSIGSKNFAEQYILGQIYAQALTAAGFDVKGKVADLGAEQRSEHAEVLPA